MIDWEHVIVEAFSVAGPIIIYMAANRRKAKRDNDNRAASIKASLDDIKVERMFLPPHTHIEQEGPLQAEGIIKRKDGNGKKP